MQVGGDVKEESGLPTGSGLRLCVLHQCHVGRPTLVRSRGDIIPRPSPLDLSMRLSPHSAPDVLSFRFCAYGGIDDSFGEEQQGYLSSSCGDYRQYGGVGRAHRLAFLAYSTHMHGFAVVKL